MKKFVYRVAKAFRELSLLFANLAIVLLAFRLVGYLLGVDGDDEALRLIFLVVLLGSFTVRMSANFVMRMINSEEFEQETRLNFNKFMYSQADFFRRFAGGLVVKGALALLLFLGLVSMFGHYNHPSLSGLHEHLKWLIGALIGGLIVKRLASFAMLRLDKGRFERENRFPIKKAIHEKLYLLRIVSKWLMIGLALYAILPVASFFMYSDAQSRAEQFKLAIGLSFVFFVLAGIRWLTGYLMHKFPLDQLDDENTR